MSFHYTTRRERERGTRTSEVDSLRSRLVVLSAHHPAPVLIVLWLTNPVCAHSTNSRSPLGSWRAAFIGRFSCLPQQRGLKDFAFSLALTASNEEILSGMLRLWFLILQAAIAKIFIESSCRSFSTSGSWVLWSFSVESDYLPPLSGCHSLCLSFFLSLWQLLIWAKDTSLEHLWRWPLLPLCDLC